MGDRRLSKHKYFFKKWLYKNEVCYKNMLHDLILIEKNKQVKPKELMNYMDISDSVKIYSYK